MDQSVKFHCEALRMEPLDRHGIEETGGKVAALKSKASEQLLELNWYPQSEYPQGSELDRLAFEVDDVKSEAQRLMGLGAEAAREVEVRAKHIVGFVKDPNGIWLELYQPRTT